jgi:hypothetical protein
MLESKFKVLLSTIPVALSATLIVLVVQSAALPAMAQAPQETFFERAVRMAQAGAGDQSTSATEERGGGAAAAAAALLRQGQISSTESEVPGRDDAQSVVIVEPRDDNAVLSGILTYHASRPVDLFVWNNVELENTTAIPEEFGDLEDIVDIGGKTFALAGVSSGDSGSIPFTGNAIEAVGEEDPFIVTYSLNAFPALANLVSDISSLTSFDTTEADEVEDSDDEDDEDDEDEG